MDSVIRVLIFVVLGALLLACNVIYVRSVVANFRKDDTVILPITVIGQDDKDGKLGTAIARMLSIRLKSLGAEIAGAQVSTSNNVQVFHPAAIRSDASPLEPIKIDAKVAGVDVGTILPWVQNFLSSQHGVAFTLDFVDKDKVLVIGDLKTIANDEHAVVSFQSSAAHDKVVDDLAHVILQARLESRMRNGVDTLAVADFEQVVRNLSRVAAVNQSIAQGQVAQSSDLAEILDGLRPVALKLPGWWQLNYITALVAQRAADSNTAIALYQNVKASGSKPSPPPELLVLLNSGEIDRAIETLSKVPVADGAGNLDAQFPPDTSEKAVRARPRIEADVDYAFKRYESLFSLERPRPSLHVFKGGEPNTFFVPTQNAYYAPAEAQFIPDVTYHEVAHVFIESLGKLSYEGQSGAIIESYADICASWVSQQKFGQTAQDADWTIGAGFIALIDHKDPQKDRTPIRSLKAPGTVSKYDGSVDNYGKIPKDNVELHMASGVPNKAFYEAAVRISTDKAIAIWIAAMPQLKPTATIPDLALATIQTARTLQGEPVAGKIREAWSTVGLSENVAESLARSDGKKQ